MLPLERTLTFSEPTDPEERSAALPGEAIREVGPYIVSGEIGRGGRGRVLEAWDTRLGRAVALKEPLHSGRAAQARFAHEARLTARLQHPGVVPIYEAGETPAGEPYYAMRFVSGRSLRDLLEERPTLAARLALLPAVLAAADTIAYAHSRSIVHRDLKPANVMMGAFGETVVIDWGLGKSLDDDDDAGAGAGAAAACERDREITQSGSVLGTPAFMPPEQAAGQPVDFRADVYALGAILYNVLTGVAPYAAAAAADDCLAAVRQGPPPDVVAIEPAAPRDLVAIVDKAMARDRELRYPTAAQLAEDLRRFHTGQLVRAHRYPPLALAARWVRRHPFRVAAVAVVMAVVLVVAQAVLGADQLRSARDSADSSRRLAESRTQQLGASEQDSRRKAEALRLGDAARRLSQDPAQALAGLAGYPLDGVEWQRVEAMVVEAARLGLPDWIAEAGSDATAVFAPDGASIAVVSRRAVAVLDAAIGARRQDWPLRLEPFDAIVAVFWLSSDRLLISLRSGLVVAFDRGGDRRDLACSRAAATAAAAAAPAMAVVSANDGAVNLCDLATGRVELLHRHRGRAVDVALAGARAFSVGSDGVLAAAAVDGQVRARRDLGAGSLSTLAVRVTGGRIDVAVGTEAGDLLVVDGETLQIRRRLHRFNARLESLAWLAGSDTLVVGTGDQVVHTMRIADGRELVVAAGDRFAQSPAGDWIAVSAIDGRVTLFDPRTAWRRTLKAHGSELHALSLAPDGRIVTVGADASVRLWGRSNLPARLYSFDGLGAYLDAIPGRDDFVIASDTGQLQLCQPSGPCRVTRLPAAVPTLVRLGAIADPIAAADLGRGTIHLFDRSLVSLGRIEIGEPLRDVRGSGSRFLAVSRTGALHLADARDRSVERLDLGAACPQASRVRWLPEQRCLVACGGGALVVFDLATRTPHRSDRIANADPARGIVGMGHLRDGSLLALLDSGELHRLGSEPRTLFTCGMQGSRLFEATDGGMWVSECGGRMRVVEDDGQWTESIELAQRQSTVADMDASAHRKEVMIGMDDRLVLWSYRDSTIKIAGSSMVVYNVEVGGGDQILAASAPGSVQLWDLSGAPAIPVEKRRLASWIGAQARRYGFEHGIGTTDAGGDASDDTGRKENQR